LPAGLNPGRKRAECGVPHSIAEPIPIRGNAFVDDTAGCVAIYFRATSRSMNSVLVDAS
jgi:hypothetical protein